MQIRDERHGAAKLVDASDGGRHDAPIKAGLLQTLINQRQFLEHFVGDVFHELGLERGKGAEAPFVPIIIPLNGDLPNGLDLAQMLLQQQQVVRRRQIHPEDHKSATNLGFRDAELKREDEEGNSYEDGT